MTALSSVLYKRLHQALLACAPTSSDRELRALFVDRRVAAWRDLLPEANSPARRVELVIDFLGRQQDEAGNNGLVLFIGLLAEQMRPGDRCLIELPLLAQELADELQGGVPDESGALPDEPAPYCGLAAFGRDQAPFFYGRQEEIEGLWRLIQHNPFVAVTGASGRGKSSLVAAGILPRAAAQSQAILHFVPGSRPCYALAAQLCALTNPSDQADYAAQVDELEQRLLARGDGASTWLAAWLARQAEGKRVFIFVDQLEELFTLTTDDGQRRQFAANLAGLAQGRTRVVAALRLDFVDQAMQLADLSPLLGRHQFVLGPLSKTGLHEAITLPAEKRGARLEKGLAEVILREVDHRSEALPLLQATMTQLWQRRVGRLLTHEAFAAMGSVGQAIEWAAEEVYNGLDEQGQRLARHLFLRLVHLSEQGSYSRSRLSRADLPLAEATPADWDRLLWQLSGQQVRLVTVNAGILELTHESIITVWPRLGRWLDENRSQLIVWRRLTQAAGVWQEHGEDASFLYRGAQLEQAQTALPAAELNLLESRFLQAGLLAQAQQQTAEQAQAATAGTLSRFTWGLRVVLTLLLLAAGGTLVYRQWLRQQAIDLAGALVWVDAGAITIGADAGLPEARPPWTAQVAGFYMEGHEVSNRQYGLCMRVACTEPKSVTDDWQNEASQALPVVGVSAAQAWTYCRWIGRRLPLEVEWEMAARGPELRPWPWGDAALDETRANVAFGPEGNTLQAVETLAAGRTPGGIYHLAGNVLEWTGTLFQPYPYADPYGAAVWDGAAPEARLVVRGSSYSIEAPEQARPTFRADALSTVTRHDLGFRCAADGQPPASEG